MPSLKTIGQQQAAAAASASKLQGNFDAVWSTSDPSKVSHDGQGVYSYTGSGGNAGNIGNVRTIWPLDPLHKNRMSSFEVTIVETGERNMYNVPLCVRYVYVYMYTVCVNNYMLNFVKMSV